MTTHRTTTTTKRYDPPLLVAETLNVTVRIEVEGTDGDEALALADCLYDAVEDTHRAFGGDSDE